MSDDIALLSAAELIAGYRDGSLSPVAATEAALARIETHNGKYNVFRLVDAEGALAASRESEERWHIKAPRGRVDGVPTAIKDILLTKGWSTPRGSKTVDLDQPWEEDAPVDQFWKDSPLREVWKVTTPTLFLVGEEDPRVPMPQSVEMYRGLKANGVPTHLYVAPRQGHGWRELRHRLFKANVELDWWEQWVSGREYTWETPPGEEPVPEAN